VDASKNSALLSMLPFKIVQYPSIFSYAPTGDFDLLSIASAFNPSEIKRTLRELLGKAVENIGSNSVSHFLELGPAYIESKPVTKFNVLLLPKKKDPPLEFLKNAMNNLGIINMGIVQSEYRNQVLKQLKIDPRKNMLFSYKKFNSSNEQTQIFENGDVSVNELNVLVNLMIKHTIIDIYRNNYRHYCVDQENNEKPSDSEENEQKDEQRTVCVLSLLLEGGYDENERLKVFQRYVHQKFTEKYAKFTYDPKTVPNSVQYGTLNVKWHTELQEFLFKTQTMFKTEKTRLNYLIISPDNDAFTIVSPQNCISKSKNPKNSTRA